MSEENKKEEKKKTRANQKKQIVGRQKKKIKKKIAVHVVEDYRTLLGSRDVRLGCKIREAPCVQPWVWNCYSQRDVRQIFNICRARSLRQGAEGSQPCLSQHSPPMRGRRLHI